jgi:hypothetical protein
VRQDEEAPGVKTEGVDLAPPLKKQKTTGASSGRPKAAKKVWEEGEPVKHRNTSAPR